MFQCRYLTLYFLSAIFIFSISFVDAQEKDKLSSLLKTRIADSGADTQHKVWIYFTNKDESQAAYSKALTDMNTRVAKRRANIPPDRYDLPVKEGHIDVVRSLGGKDIRASRWLNAVSARLTNEQIDDIAGYDFVEKVDIVRVLRRSPRAELEPPPDVPPPEGGDYGNSYTQNHLLGIDSLHQLTINDGGEEVSISGSGVLLAFLDSGFEVEHPAFDSSDIIDTWDYINDDASVNDELPTFIQPRHGTLTYSACGGYAPGDLIGPAYGASYALYKTEITSTETEIEEDNWVFAAERADTVGADIISTSLGYSDWYEYSDMDGNTAVTTIAADIAASRGILVVVSAGNEGNDPWKYITAPSDGDSVIAVGAVSSTGTITAFSSFGPSYDGRIKPEMVAMGSYVWCASYTGGYTSSSGTSLSCPLIAGSAALVIQANPSLRGNPMAVRERLIMAGDRYPNADPDQRYGFGLPNVVLAAGFGIRIHPIDEISLETGVSTALNITTVAPLGGGVVFEPVDFPVSISFEDNGDGTGRLTVVGDYDRLGTFSYHLAATSSEYVDTLEFLVSTTTSEGPAAFYIGPNPFTESLTFRLAQPIPGGYDIEIFSLAGELLFHYRGEANIFTWTGVNDQGQKIASGVYIIRFSADGIEERLKVFKL